MADLIHCAAIYEMKRLGYNNETLERKSYRERHSEHARRRREEAEALKTEVAMKEIFTQHKLKFFEGLDRIKKESEDCGSIDVVLVPWGSEFFGRLYALGAMDNYPRCRCYACKEKIKLPPAALLSFEATENPTMRFPQGLRRNCYYHYSVEELQSFTKEIVRAIVGDTPITIRFCQAPLRGDEQT